MPIAPPEILQAARRQLEGIKGFTVTGDFVWFASLDAWAFPCRITIDCKATELVPRTTKWWFLVQDTFPFGYIKVYPDRSDGIAKTFPHQSYNNAGSDGVPWTQGDICLRTPHSFFGRAGYDDDPLGNTKRLRWYARRAVEWVTCAAENRLANKGDPYELPAFPSPYKNKYTVAFHETADTFATWQALDLSFGLVDLVPIGPRSADFLVARQFKSKKEVVISPPWGTHISSYNSPATGGWLRIDRPPIQEPYQVPLTWGELFELDPTVREKVRALFNLLRDGESHLILVGFPIPEFFGGPDVQLHWQPLFQWSLSHGDNYAPGFRASEVGYWRLDHREHLAVSKPIKWQRSKNWEGSRSRSRGVFQTELASQKIALIGCGALGSAIAEMLVRGAVNRVLLIDRDTVGQENLCRHILDINSLERAKAVALAERLNRVNLHARVEALSVEYPRLDARMMGLLEECDVIVDCTAEDNALHALSQVEWPEPKLFLSASVSFGAQKLYCFTARSRRFPLDEFMTQVSPWLDVDRAETQPENTRPEGIGCWHPAFPARIDHIWKLAATAVTFLAEVVSGAPQRGLVVFELAANGEVSRAES